MHLVFMKRYKILIQIVLLFSILSIGSLTDLVAQQYDANMAQEVGADDYGMRSYVMAFLKAGPIKFPNADSAQVLQAAHMANIKRLAEDGKLVLAGPFLDNGALRGIYVFDVRTIDEARQLTETDPAIQAGTLVMELHPWYGSAALMKLNEMHQKIQKTSF